MFLKGLNHNLKNGLLRKHDISVCEIDIRTASTQTQSVPFDSDSGALLNFVYAQVHVLRHSRDELKETLLIRRKLQLFGGIDIECERDILTQESLNHIADDKPAFFERHLYVNLHFQFQISRGYRDTEFLP